MADENTTRETPDARPFEERVLSILTEMRADFNARLEKLEAKAYDTKPIWERALAEIVVANKRLEDFDVRFDRMESDVAKTRRDANAAGRLQRVPGALQGAGVTPK